MAKKIQAEALAISFKSVMTEWLTQDELLEVDCRNAKELSDGVCHSHDFCDANMAMLEAYKNLTGEEHVPYKPNELKLWNDAWDSARLTGFASSK